MNKCFKVKRKEKWAKIGNLDRDRKTEDEVAKKKEPIIWKIHYEAAPSHRGANTHIQKSHST